MLMCPEEALGTCARAFALASINASAWKRAKKESRISLMDLWQIPAKSRDRIGTYSALIPLKYTIAAREIIGYNFGN